MDEEFLAIAKPLLLDEEYQTLKRYIAHGDFTVYDHSLLVAERSYLYAKKNCLLLDYSSLVRGALLHDYYLYDWHKSHKGHRLHGFRHPAWGLYNALRRYDLNPIERNIIRSHMFPLTFFHWPHSKEAWIVSHFDHVEAWHETFTKRENDSLLLSFSLAN